VARNKSYAYQVAAALSDTVDQATPFKALHISVGGTLRITNMGGAVVNFPAVPVGTLEVSGRRVHTTGTAATGIVCLS